MEKIRIQKIISDSGYCSRRKAEAFIESGAVKLNGRPVTLGDKADAKNDIITINGERISGGQTLRYIKLYKPRGYVTTMADEHAKKIITELLAGVKEKVYPVGRLDKNSEGLILLTNDGKFANEITHPSHNITKTYRVTIPDVVAEEKIALMSAGIDIGGEVTRPCVINVLDMHGGDKARTVLEFVISEGKNRQIRRMCEAVDIRIVRLKRTSVGGVRLGMLRPGEYADLTQEELRLLKANAQKKGRNKKK